MGSVVKQCLDDDIDDDDDDDVGDGVFGVTTVLNITKKKVYSLTGSIEWDYKLISTKSFKFKW